MPADDMAALVIAVNSLRMVIGIVGAALCVSLVCCVFLMNSRRDRS